MLLGDQTLIMNNIAEVLMAIYTATIQKPTELIGGWHYLTFPTFYFLIVDFPTA